MTAVPDIDSLRPGDELPLRQFHPDTIQLFLYNAALWNAHKIHFDQPYATAVEGYPGIVVPGPLLGDWMTQTAVEWLGDSGSLLSFEYTNRRFACAGEALRSIGKVASVDRDKAEVVLSLAVVNEAGEVLTPGTAVVRLGPA